MAMPHGASHFQARANDREAGNIFLTPLFGIDVAGAPFAMRRGAGKKLRMAAPDKRGSFTIR
jgi:hypothetical protein